jgi:hypothetical protein
VAVGVSVTDTTGSMGQLQIMAGGGTVPPVVLTFAAPGVTVGLTTGGTVGTGTCGTGAFTQAQVQRENKIRAARSRTGVIVFRFMGIILIWHEKGDNCCLDFENIRTYIACGTGTRIFG